MASKRDAIRLTDEEIAAYLAEEKTVIVGTNGPRGVPHLMPLWFVLRHSDGGGAEVWGWTFAKSQKAVNLRRDPRATILFEDGVLYNELRGVMYECDVEVIEDTAAVRQIGIELFTKYGTGEAPAPEVIAMIEAQAPKRIGLRFNALRTVSWDHRKLGGTY